ncbi:membrane protein [Clostridium sp. CTA-7]
MEENKKKKYLFIFLAINLIGIAVALFLESQLGCDPTGVLYDGISRFISIKFGSASFIYNLLLIGIAFLIARNNLGIGTIVYGLLAGFFIDFYRGIFSQFELASMGIQYAVLVFLIGELCMSLAIAILIQLKLGMTALDCLLVKFKEHFHISYAFLKIGIDIFYVVIGTSLGGIFGIGTIISAMVTGILVSKFVKVIEIIQLKTSKIEGYVVKDV